MKRIHLLLLLLSVLSLQSVAVDLSPTTRLRLQQPHAVLSRGEDQIPPFQPIMLLIDDDSVIDQLIALDVAVYHRRDDILLTSVPRERIAEVLELPGIVYAETGGDMSANMDKARPFGQVNVVHEGIDGLPYDGTGIIVGFTDSGFDSKHIAFKDRVVAFFDYDAQENRVRRATTKDELDRWTTDNYDEYHATHVANILAGSYKGAPYYGVATGAEIVAATSRLTDVGILSGIEDIIAYAKSVGKPAVINMSLGSSLGSHDGTSLFCRYLSRCAEDAIICVSAGNTGATSGYAYQFVEDRSKIYRFLVNCWSGFDVQGITELWSATSDPFDFRVEVFDMEKMEIVYESPWITGPEDCSMIHDNDNAAWYQYMGGIISVEAGISPLNGRYTVSAYYNTHTDEPAANSDGRWSRYYTSLAFRASQTGAPTNVDVFADSHISRIGKATNETMPHFSYDGSINEFCTAEGVIAVGACSSRNVTPSLYGGNVNWPYNVDNVAAFSSYSRRFNMAELPHFAAPGNYVVSAISSPYMSVHDESNGLLADVSCVDGEYYYWSSQCGTSMASPYAAGIIALWLQANPNLTTAEVLRIAQSTAIRDYADIDNPRWGAGCINAAGGLREVIASVHDITVTSDRERYYTLTGLEVDPSKPLPHGIYIVISPDSPPKKVKL